MADRGNLEDSANVPPDDSIRAELDRILESITFANAGRLRAFLNYVVEERLAGQAHLIAGKTIAQDVYSRAPGEGSDSIVRVDAGRLRRKLSEYYDTEGSDDPIRIHIDSGGYAPRFEISEPERTPSPLEGGEPTTMALPSSVPSRKLLGAIALALVALIGAVLLATQGPQDVPTPLDYAARNQSERSVLAAKSAATLQAANLAEQASGLLFPIADVEHQELATSMFREAMRIDPNFAEGFAGAAHSLGTLSLLAQTAETRDAFLNEARALADKATDLAPRSGWSQSAAAWVAFVDGKSDRAVDLSRIAASLDEVDSRVLDFRGVILGTTGHFEESAKISAPEHPRNSNGRHPAHLNIHGVAHFHLGNYEVAIASFDAAVQQGGPVSELTLMYKAAASEALGDTATAKALLDELQTTWPTFRPEVVAARFYQQPEHAEQVLAMLRAAGWSFGN